MIAVLFIDFFSEKKNWMTWIFPCLEFILVAAKLFFF